MDIKSIEKFFCLDVFYCVMSLYLILLIIEQKNILDILYLGVLTYYYIRIKLNRRNNKKFSGR